MFKRQSKLPELVLEKNAALTIRQANLGTTANGDSPPPSYSASAAEQPPPDISTAFANLNLDEPSALAQTPTPDECLAHLKLLEAFHALRQDVYQNDGLFGINDCFATASTERERNRQLANFREKRWQVYVSKANKRFEAWWMTCVLPEARRQTQFAVNAVGRTPWIGEKLEFKRQNLPPIDVVMVWHAYQLNPRNFLEDCILLDKMDAWRAGLPWAVINSCIDNESFEYDASSEARELFESLTQHCWDSLQDPELVEIKCPKCDSIHEVPWTRWDNQSAWRKNSNGGYFGEHDATGYADKSFTISCKCSKPFEGLQITTHGVLRAQRFRRDCEALKLRDISMQGTCLDSNGIPEALFNLSGRASFFPNRFILGKPSNKMMFTNICAITDLKPSNPSTMNSVRAEIEKGFADRDYIDTANGHKPTRDERIALRHMMSCYWENASPFSLDLVGAVIRQSTFIEKMHRINWIHSPAARFTMERVLVKYGRYLAIVASSKGSPQIAVPTLDVDLAWHTHQLRPPTYFRHTVSLLGKFLNHDDKIEDTILSTAFEWTSKTYQKMYNELYSECTCWYCEAVRESHASKLRGLNLRKKFGGKASVIEQQLNQVHSARDESAEMNHISSHNSIRPDSSSSDRIIRERNMRIKLECDYKKAVIKARKQGREPPVRDEYYYAYGYPLYMPVYLPYQGDPCVSEGMYPANPSCATFVPGASGNCAAGTCGGGVAAGACGGGGSCTSAGGCSGGGDGGDGGDGGCGGGCGGCG